jgi:hypothetical protein
LNRRSSRLLARGGRSLGLASVALAHGQRPGQGPWHALAPDLIAAAEEVMLAVDEEDDPAILAAALDTALGPDAASATPSWIGELDGAVLERLFAGLPDVEVPPAVRKEARSAADAALWALALAFCRNPDAARAVAEKFADAATGARLQRWSRLAQAVARPGEPSRMRRRLKALLAAGENRDG